MSVAAQFFYRNLLDNLRFGPVGTDVLFMVIGPLVGLASSRGWGRLMDRWGRRPVLILATACTVLSVMPYFFASRHTPNPGFVIDGVNGLSGAVGRLFGMRQWSWLSSEMPVGAWMIMSLSVTIGGCGWMGVMLAQSGIVLGFSDGHGRSKYIAAHAVLISVGGAAGGIAGGSAAHALRFLQGSPIALGPLEWNNWHATFALSLLARVTALLLLVNMPDPGAGKMRDLVREFTANVYNNVGSRLFYPLRIFGWGRRRGGPADAPPRGGPGDDK
jgi:MFS family permease